FYYAYTNIVIIDMPHIFYHMFGVQNTILWQKDFSDFTRSVFFQTNKSGFFHSIFLSKQEK
ncbi:MAG: hypothetical protein EBY38_08210, partial [Flavobacteriaceae bacterium]|nr:hypothetical protein [Flavobacteriaceae bacterium]